MSGCGHKKCKKHCRKLKLDCDGNLRIPGDIKACKIKAKEVETSLSAFKPSDNGKTNGLHVNACGQLVFTNACGQEQVMQFDQASESLVVRNAIFQGEPGASSFPPDPIMAVGPEVAVAMTNSTIAIFEKSTMERIYIQDLVTFAGAAARGGDVQVIYDELSQRFFTTAWANFTGSAEITITAPPAAVGVYAASKGSAAPNESFNIPPTPIVATVPFNANSTVTNVAEITGNIALIATDGYTTVPGGLGSRGKGNNAAAAGAIAAILYESRPADGTNIAGATNIPSVAVPYATGQIFTANIVGLTGSMKTLDLPLIENTIFFSVSKTPNPRTAADWYHYSFKQTYDNADNDFPKISVDANFLYYSTLDFPVSDDSLTSTITTFDKKKLIDGTGPVQVDQNRFRNQIFIWPTLLVPPKTDVLQPAYFIGNNAAEDPDPNKLRITALRIFTAPAFNYVDVPLPTPMNFNFSVGMKQPANVPNLESSSARGPSVVYNNSIWYSHTWQPNDAKSIVRWYELDISLFVTQNIITIKQWGDIEPADGSNCSYSCSAVAPNGDVVIGFSISGLNQAPSIAYVWRKKCDPLGTMRPIVIPVQSLYSYNGGNQQRSYGLRNRWGDYSSVVYRDGKFWLFNEYPLQVPPFANPTTKISLRWSTAIVVFDPNSDCNADVTVQEAPLEQVTLEASKPMIAEKNSFAKFSSIAQQ